MERITVKQRISYDLLELQDGFQLDKMVKKNQTIIVRYTKINYATNATTITDENVIIDNSNLVNYTLNY